MKKLIATLLTLAMLLAVPCALAEQVPAINWEDVEAATEGIQGSWYTYDDIAMQHWIPDTFQNLDLTDEDGEEMLAMVLTCAIAMAIALGICAFVRQPGRIKKYYEMTEHTIFQMNPKDRFRVDFSEVKKAIIMPNRIRLYRRVIRMDVRIPAEDYQMVKFHILSRLGPDTEIIYQ